MGESDKGFQELQIKIQALVLYLLTSSTSFPIWAPSRVQRYRKPVSCAYIHRLFLAPAIVTIVRRQTRTGSHTSCCRMKAKTGDRTRSPTESDSSGTWAGFREKWRADYESPFGVRGLYPPAARYGNRSPFEKCNGKKVPGQLLLSLEREADARRRT